MVDVDLERFNHIRLRAVPQGGRASEEIERCERKKKKKQGQPRGYWGGASLCLSSSPLGNFALSSLVLPSLDSTD